MQNRIRKSGRFGLAMLLVCMMAVTPLITIWRGSASYSYSYALNVSDVTGEKDKAIGEYLKGEEVSLFMPDDIVEVIIRLKDNSVVDTYLEDYADQYGTITEYMTAFEGKRNVTSITNWQNTIKQNLEDTYGIEIMAQHSALLNGFTARMRYGDIAALNKNKNVEIARVSEFFAAPEVTEANIIENPVAIHETGIYDSSQLNTKGEGTVIAVLDTGLDYLHEAFSTMPSSPSISKGDVENIMQDSAAWLYSYYASNYIKSITADDVYVNEKVPFAFNYADLINYISTGLLSSALDVMPYEDHGTHVAGIIAGESDTITGVATEAQLVIMQVFDSITGSASETGILLAISDAVLLGVDVINMSLGTPAGFATDYDDFWNEIYGSVSELGVSLVVAAGNSNNSFESSSFGSTALLTNPDAGMIGAPASFDSALAVASISGVKSQYIIANGNKTLYLMPSTNGVYSPDAYRNFTEDLLGNSQSGEYQYIRIQGVGRASDYQGLDVAGKIVLVPRGDITFEQKARNAAARNAAGVIIVNNVSGSVQPHIGSFLGYPVAGLTMDAAVDLPQTGTIRVAKDYLAGPFMSSFSSWGVLANLELKPDITAHGGEVLSSVPGKDRDGNWKYARQSGTSMAAPNLAGIMALVRQYVKEANPEFSAVEVTERSNQLMMSTATIALDEDGNPYSPRKQGAGLANVYHTVDTEVFMSVKDSAYTKLSVGDDVEKTGKYELTFELHNTSNTARSFMVNTKTMTETVSSDEITVAAKSYILDSKFAIKAKGGVSTNGTNSVSIGGRASGEITVTITLTGEDKRYMDESFANGMFVEGFVQLLPSFENGIELSIPWVGFYGDWSKAPIYDVTIFDVTDSQQDQSIKQEDKLKAVLEPTEMLGGFFLSESEAILLPIGQYPIDLFELDGRAAPIPNRDKAAVSGVMDLGTGMFSVHYITLGSLRSARETNISVYDSITGREVYNQSFPNTRKAFSQGSVAPSYLYTDINPATYGLYNNAKYTIDISSKLDWDGEQNNLKDSFTMDFYVDSDAPILREDLTTLRIEERNNRKTYFLDIHVYDNHYAETLIMGIPEADGSLSPLSRYIVNPLDTRRNETTVLTYDITDNWDNLLANGEQIYLELYDTARNASQYMITLPRIQAENIAFRDNEIEVKQNETIDLKSMLSVVPDDAWKFNLDWTTDDVNSTYVRIHDGEIMGVAPTAPNSPVTVRVTANEMFSADIKVNVIASTLEAPAITGLKLNQVNLSVVSGATGTLTATPIPWNADMSNVTIEWSAPSSFINLDEVWVDNVLNPMSIKYTISGAPDTINTTGFVRAMVAGRTIFADCDFSITREFEIENGIITDYNGNGGNNGVVTIPEGLGVTEIGSTAFANSYNIRELIIEEKLTKIGSLAFFNARSLERVVLPDTVEHIGANAFEGCANLTEINLDYVRYIGREAFTAIQIEKLELGNAYYIGREAFNSNYAVRSIDIRNLQHMGEAAFAYNAELHEIITSERTMIASSAFIGCTSLTTLNINAKNIGMGAFANCTSLMSVTFNNELYRMGVGVFYGNTNLKVVNFTGSLERLPSDTFTACWSLETVYLPDDLVAIDGYAFFDCPSLTSVYIPATARLSEVGVNLFGIDRSTPNTQVRYYIDPANPYIVGDNLSTPMVNGHTMIYNADTTKLISALPVATQATSGIYTAPNTLRVIGQNAFSSNKNLQKLQLTGETEIILESGAFESSNLKEINIPINTSQMGIRSIGVGAFFATKLVTFPLQPGTKLEYIGDSAFRNATEFIGFGISDDSKTIKTHTDLSNVYYIGHEAFYACAKLETIDLSKTQIDAVNIYTFYSTGIKTITLPDTVTLIRNYAFSFSNSLTSIGLSSNLVEIQPNAFMACRSLISLRLPASLKLIGAEAFYSAEKLATIQTVYTHLNGEIELQSGLSEVLEIGAAAFFNTALTEFYADKLIVMGNDQFAIGNTLNDKITTVYLPRAVVVGNRAFYGMTALRNAYMPNVLSVGDRAFYNTTALTSLSIPNVREVGSEAFRLSALRYINADSLEYIAPLAFAESNVTTLIASNLRVIDKYAFALGQMSKIYLPATLETVAEGAFTQMTKLSSFEVDPANQTFFTDDGVLYSHVNGGYQLVAYPTQRTERAYTVLDGTVRIGAEAFLGNPYLTEVTLPWRLRAIGDAAFYGCSSLILYRFNGYEAPILETSFQDGYWNLYYNFTDYIGTAGIIIERAENAVGFESFIYQNYFATTYLGAIVADNITMAAINIIDMLPQEITLESAAAVQAARTAYDGVSEEQKPLVHNAEKLFAAEQALLDLNKTPVDNSWISGLAIALGLTGMVIGIALVSRAMQAKKKA